MANVLSETKRDQVVALGRLGWTLRRIEEATGVRRETASTYLKAAGIAVRQPGGWGRRPFPKPAIETSTDSGAMIEPPEPARSPQASACEPYREQILEAIGRRRNAMAIWQDLVDRHGFSVGYPSVRRFVRTLRAATVPEAHPVIVTAPGEEAQVDYGDGAMCRDPKSGKYRRTRLFVLTLGFSRKSVRLLTWKSSTRIWAELHEEAFRRIGGVARTVVLDNLKEGVLTPDVYDPAINPLYRDLLAHYGAVALPCRVRHPDRKGKVEASVGHTQRTPLRGMRFESIEEGQAYLDHWDARWADTRIHGTTKRQVAAMFAEERPALLPLPLAPFRYYEHGKRTVHLDGCVEIEGAYYSVPPGHIGERIPVQWDGHTIRLLDPKTGQLLREHRRLARGHHRIAPDDVPPRTPPETVALLARATRAGKAIGAVCAAIYEHDGPAGVRRILGVLSLAKKHGVAAVEDACAAALEIGFPTYRFVRRYCERHLRGPLTLRQVDPLIRQLTLYRDLIDRQTTKEVSE
jgi:transposase